MSRRTRVAILHQGFIPHYRVGCLRLLCARRDLDYVVLHGRPPPSSGHRVADDLSGIRHRRVGDRWCRIAGRWLVWQQVFRRLTRDGYRALVLGHELKFLVGWAAALWFRFSGRRLVLWGHGFEKAERIDASQGLVVSLRNIGKLALLHLAHGYLVYTAQGAERLVAAGYPRERITIVDNSIDTAGMLRAARRCAPEAAPGPADCPRERLGADLVAVFVGRLYAEKAVLELAHAVAGDARWALVVVGDGPQAEALRAVADPCARIHLVGERLDGAWLREVFAMADVVTLPGKAGLAVNHALAHGRPVAVCAGAGHAPEVGYLTDGLTGLVVEGDAAVLLERAAEWCQRPLAERRLSWRACRERAAGLSVAHMASAFHRGVRAALVRGGPA